MMRVLIANRGEIARRIARACVEHGHVPVALTTPLDAGSVHAAEAGECLTVDSYLDGAAIVAGAVEASIDAVHPGYGFLAENTEFARAVADAGLVWIGPRAEVIDSMGSKINARAIAEGAGVPVIPGYSDSQADADLLAAAERIGWPILVKASAGGGGKGIRIARSADAFELALTEARGEAGRSFGDDSVIVERYIERPRHVEVQIVGDRHGTVVHLGTRECSVQRRYQKLFEEAPAPNLPDATRAGLHDAAVALGAAVGYDSAGTVEFIVDDASGDFFFLEMNTRLQVEHPVTELVTGVDIVGLMIDVASGSPLSVSQSDVGFTGHALEARITAEDAGADFAPQIGTVHHLQVPPAVRWDAAIEAGSEVTPHFDSMIAKLIVHGPDRVDALGRMRSALDGLIVGGVTTSAGFHRWLVDRPEVIDGRVTTRLLDETQLPPPPEPAVEAAASAWASQLAQGDGEPTSAWHACPGFSLIGRPSTRTVGLRALDGTVHEVTPQVGDTAVSPCAIVDLVGRRVSVNVEGHTHHFEVPTRTERWAPSVESRAGTGDALVAPFPAMVTEVNVVPGDEVAGDQVLVVIEAMKMLHSLKADGAAVVDEVRVAAGDQVAGNDILVTFASTPQLTDGDDS